MVPPGSRGVIYEYPDSRDNWGTRGTDAWSISPSLNNYRVLWWLFPEKNGLIFSGSFDLLPQLCLFPEFTPEKHANELYDELVDSIHKINPDEKSKLLKKMETFLG